MTVIDPGSSRPSRLIGLVLIGIAVLAAVLGVLSLIDDGPDGGGQAQPPSSTPQTGTTTETGTSTETSAPNSSPPGSTPPGSTTSGQPPATQPPPASQPGGQPPPPPPAPNPRAVPVRVYNNGTVAGLAAEAAKDFRADGWTVTDVGNYSQGIIPTTTVYFRPGTEEEAAARELGARFNMRVEPRFPGIVNTPPGLIVLVTNDYGGK
ncbi:MAG TPA: LytR C-terminal domain-containing protein [Actinophytocola sp.]|uniref:LytR C-terminal domain-containing protein n=1 Tax=Actinophytocola sp. TaxID=1872138 RepID=UPI002DBCDB37|nr:LytR C-terminal domain-containing protein [Actinophytocola sp.]HEU5471717.1 LytR C-terminal domain-containing protein [Actinophytocola sp.]